MGYQSPPRLLPGFPNAVPVPPKTPYPGGMRKRWEDPDGEIIEWDYQHGEVEVYDSRGRHLGQFDHETGERQKDADPTRRVEP
jgi:hypothetical protein